MIFVSNERLANCPWGPVTAHMVGLLTTRFLTYVETYMSVGPLAAAGETVMD